jgi:hypothetical protein
MKTSAATAVEAATARAHAAAAHRGRATAATDTPADA